MKSIAHPTFQKTLQRQFLIIWGTCVLCFGGGLYFLKHGHEQLGWVLASVFAVSGVCGLLYLYFNLHHVICLVCNGKTKTKADRTRGTWIASCEHCQIEWDLQTGIGNGLQ
ncbi:MAG: hypothetical protein ABL902_09585 [Gallionella sp.]